VIFEARDRASHNKPGPSTAPTIRFNIPTVTKKSAPAPAPPVFSSANAVPVRAPLRNVTNNTRNQKTAAAQGFTSLIKASSSQQPAPAAFASPAGREVDNPHWVLGVTKQAVETE
jgi:hypothetical protein